MLGVRGKDRGKGTRERKEGKTRECETLGERGKVRGEGIC